VKEVGDTEPAKQVQALHIAAEIYASSWYCHAVLPRRHKGTFVEGVKTQGEWRRERQTA
jgi:hypothetical protein